VECSLPEAETRVAYGRLAEAANLPTFLKFQNTKNQAKNDV